MKNQKISISPERKVSLATYALGAMGVIALGFGGGWLGAMSQQQDEPQSFTQQKVVLSDRANLISSIANNVGKSVVSVDVTSEATGSYSPFDLWFGIDEGNPSSRPQQSAGTGVIISEDGLVLTNKHVVPVGTTAVSLTLSDGTVLDNVKVLGRTPENDSLDIAFLKIEDSKGQKLVAAKLGDSAATKVGETVVAIGNTLGQFQNTVTSGIISGYGRSVDAASGRGGVESLDDLFQTDAAINEGNSGGPLVNLNGEVIGINTAIASGSQNVGFAIPINNIKGLIESVQKSGKIERPYLGVRYVLLTDDIAKRYELATNRGAYIPPSVEMGQSSVMSGGPADDAGIKEGDIITKVEGSAVNEKTSLVSLLGKRTAGDSVKLTINRGGETLTITVTLGVAPESALN